MSFGFSNCSGLQESRLVRLKAMIKWNNTALKEIPQDVIARINLRQPVGPHENVTFPPPPKRVKPSRESVPIRKTRTSRFPHKEAEVKYEEQREDREKSMRERMSKHQLQTNVNPSTKSSSPVSLDDMSRHELQEVRFKAAIRAAINGYEITCKAPCLCTPAKMAHISDAKSQMMHNELSESGGTKTTEPHNHNHVYRDMKRKHLPFFRPNTAKLRLKKAQELKYKKHAVAKEHDWTYTQRRPEVHKRAQRKSCLCCRAPTSRVYRVGHGMAYP